MRKIEILLENGKWLINGKQYNELTFPEKQFFDEFLLAVRLDTEAQKLIEFQNL
jgi:hypothetical protein